MSGDVYLRDLVASAARRNFQPRNAVDRAVRMFLREIQEQLAAGKTISIGEFGRFDVIAMPPREGQDFSTGARIPVAGRPKVRFSPYQRTEKALRQRKQVVR